MFIGPISLLCAGWFFFCWLLAKLASVALKGAMKKTIKAASVIWIAPMIVGILACIKGV